MKKNNFKRFLILILSLAFVVSCSDDSDNPIVDPENQEYAFLRDGVSTVSYSGQTTRLKQANELYDGLNSENSNETNLSLMFNGDGTNSAGFMDGTLNGTTKIIGSKTSASAIAGSAATKAKFDEMIQDYSNNVVPNFNNAASGGSAGKICYTNNDGSESCYELNAKGQELDQLFFKGLIGAFTLDQIVNNYLHPNQLESGTRTQDNDNNVLSSGKNYTDMEHKWDEAFGYLYGETEDITSNFGLPESSDEKGNLLMKYFQKVELNYEAGIAQRVYEAFIDGRQAIVDKDYAARENSARILKVELSKVIGYYAIHYLNDYVNKIANNEIARAHHSLSEAWGFILSLQFTNNGENQPYMSKAAVEDTLDNYFSDFHNMNTVNITASGTGMIDQIKSAFNNTLMID
jgi:hypothetical protein